MKDSLIAIVMAAATVSGCQKSPQLQADYGSDAETGCAAYVRERFKELELEPGDPFQKEVTALDVELRRRHYGLCLRYHELTGGKYPGME